MKKLLLTMLMMAAVSALSVNAATKYNINVAGVEVTSDNMNNIKGGDIKSGTVTFSPSTKTLTMTNVTITRTGSGDYAIHNRSYKGLIVRFVGTCNLTTKARVIRFECGSEWSRTETPLADECQLVASSGATVNLTSTGDGAIYVRDFTAVWIKGPGTFNITGNKDGAIAGHGSWNSSMTDLATIDAVKFSNVTATVTGAQSCLLGLAAHFYAGSNVTLKATNNSSYPVGRDLHSLTKFFNKAAIVSPADATFDSYSESFVINGYEVYDKDIFITDNYVAIINSTFFYDPNLRSALLNLYPKGYINQNDVNNRTYLDVSSKGISNLTGVSYFSKLTSLNCSRNSLSSLPTLPTSLQELNCEQNQLSSLPSLPSSLKTLKCGSNKLSILPTLPSTLTYLDCRNNQIATLPTLPSTLTYLDCENNQITSLPTLPSGIESIFAQNNKLTSVNTLDRGKLKTLDLRYNSSLTSLVVSRNSALTTLSLSGCSALTSLSMQSLSSFNFAGFSVPSSVTYWDCGYNNLTSLPSLPAALKMLECNNNQLTSLPTLPSTLTYLNCNNNQITSLPTLPSGIEIIVAQNNKLTSVNTLDRAKLRGLDLRYNSSLTSLVVSRNSALTTLSLSGCSALTSLSMQSLSSFNFAGFSVPSIVTYWDCGFNNLTSLPSLPAALKTLCCYHNKLTSLPTLPSGLERLECNDNQFTTLTVTNLKSLVSLRAEDNPKLTTLNCSNNALTSLNVSNNTALTTLYCDNNRLTSLPTLPNSIQKVDAYNNKLSGTLIISGKSSLKNLDVSNNTGLTTLECNNNALTSLYVSGCTSLTTLRCQLNQLSSLTNLPSSLTTLNCCYNNLSSLSASGLTALSSLQINNNKIKAAAMGNLINSLRTIPAGSNGYLYVLGLNSNTYNIPEGNEITNEQLTAAQAKRWIPMKFENGNWVDIPMPSGGMRGDVNGDGKCDVEDVNAAINITIKLKTAADYPGNADLNNDGKIDVEDVNAIINITLKL